MVPLRNPLTKVASKSWSSIWHYMEPITDDLLMRKQNKLFFEMESENCISNEL